MVEDVMNNKDLAQMVVSGDFYYKFRASNKTWAILFIYAQMDISYLTLVL